MRLGPEDSLQFSCCQWFRMQHRDKRLYAIPNGGHRHKFTAVKLKLTGVCAGVPDLCCPYPTNGYHGLYIELKVKPNKPTPEQLDWLAYLTAQGYKTAVIYSFEEFQSVVSEYLKQPEQVEV